jgi:hypothetical protein
LKRGGVSQRNEQGPRKPKRIDLTNLVALAETEANRLHPNAKLPNCVPLIDIKRQKEVLQQILIDVIAFRGVGITGSDGRRFVGGERQGGAG